MKIKFITCIAIITFLIVVILGGKCIQYKWLVHKAHLAELQQDYKASNTFYFKALKTNIHSIKIKQNLSKTNFHLGILSEVQAINDNKSSAYYHQAIYWDSLNYQALMGIARTDTSWEVKNWSSIMAFALRPQDAHVVNHFYMYGKKLKIITALVDYSEEYYENINNELKKMKRIYGNSFFTSLRISAFIYDHGILDSADAEFSIADSCFKNAQFSYAGKNYCSPEEYTDSLFLNFYYAEKSALLFRHEDYKNALIYSTKKSRVYDINILTSRSLLALGRAQEALDSLPLSNPFELRISRNKYGKYEYPFVAGQIYEALGQPDSGIIMFKIAKNKAINYALPRTVPHIVLPFTHDKITLDSIDHHIEICRKTLKDQTK